MRRFGMTTSKRIFYVALILLLVLCLCTALFSCKKTPPAEDPGGEQPSGPALPEAPDNGKEPDPRQEGDTYRY